MSEAEDGEFTALGCILIVLILGFIGLMTQTERILSRLPPPTTEKKDAGK